jgi:hypothetical protein
MSLSFGIYWASNTVHYSMLQNEINSNPDLGSSNQKNISDSSKSDKFIASAKFVGSLSGYIFQMGPNGLGYYIDSNRF